MEKPSKTTIQYPALAAAFNVRSPRCSQFSSTRQDAAARRRVHGVRCVPCVVPSALGEGHEEHGQGCDAKA